jgi:hypothetical protein
MDWKQCFTGGQIGNLGKTNNFRWWSMGQRMRRRHVGLIQLEHQIESHGTNALNTLVYNMFDERKFGRLTNGHEDII